MNPRIEPAAIRRFRFWFFVGLAAVVLASSSVSRGEQVVLATGGDSWTIDIRPGQSSASRTPAAFVPPAPEPAHAPPDRQRLVLAAAQGLVIPGPAPTDIEIVPGRSSGVQVNGRSYDEIYDGIPYSYAEYLANPGYRHEATLEILFGQMRPMTVHKHYQPAVATTPEWTPYQPYLYAKWDYYQTSTLLHPRFYSPRWYSGCCH